jgi:hypothetical protein
MIAGFVALLVVGGLIIFGITQLFGGDDNGSLLLGGSPVATSEPRPSGSPTPTATAGPGRSPTATPGPTGPGLTGRPYSFSNLQSALTAKGIASTQGSQSTGFTGMATTSYDIRMTKGSDVMEAYVLVYSTADAVDTDWTLSAGEAPSLKSGRTVPSHAARWYNGNIVILVKSRTASIYSDAFDAFISMS